MDRDRIVDISIQLNIDLIGFTHTGPLDRIRKQLECRLKEERITEFEERDVELRVEPRLTMEECKSIIVIALSYNKENDYRKEASVKGSLSKSSWGRDYHFVIKEKMEALVKEMKKEHDFNHISHCDTGPLVDREVANRAGIGYYGKNCSIINPEFGSFIFIGYILTDLEIGAREDRLESLCGDCTLCMDACPTGALEGPGILNPKKCISYLTQTKDLIPEDLSARMGIKIYGCDTCQVVCPKNEKVRLSSHGDFDPVKTGGIVDIEELVHMSKKQFQEKYGDMAGSWRGKTVLLRNSVLALENMGAHLHVDLIRTLHKKNIDLLKPYTSRILKDMVK
ncbi:tRNA epoxyqueuosine(34) reductase QueG [Gudongella sp. SC589]|jgi:epoxyqueuosine reductase|uniref:tRNA epoxyqueuosine(34) reductase QueG n=1 Tax=Gudongella sp. SC589 TaxID=3385990 RepID=UPI003904BA39